jgi:hypothetical protein
MFCCQQHGGEEEHNIDAGGAINHISFILLAFLKIRGQKICI